MKWYEYPDWKQDLARFASASELRFILNAPLCTPLPFDVARFVAQLLLLKTARNRSVCPPRRGAEGGDKKGDYRANS